MSSLTLVATLQIENGQETPWLGTLFKLNKLQFFFK